MEIETNINKENVFSKYHLNWIVSTFIKPKKTIETVVTQEKPVWLTPLLVLSVLALIVCLVGWPIRRDAALNTSSLPDNFQYYSSDQQAEYLSAQSNQSSALFTFVFPLVGSLLKIWVPFFLLSSILYLSLTLAGSRGKSLKVYNLVGWTMLPLAVRLVVQLLAMLVGHTLVTSPGLSGFITGGGGLALLAGMFGQIDIYFIWQVVLLGFGVLALSGLAKKKAWGALAITLILVLLIMGIPSLISSMLSGLSLGGLF